MLLSNSGNPKLDNLSAILYQLAEQLIEARIESGLSQEEFAQKLGTSQSTIGAIGKRFRNALDASGQHNTCRFCKFSHKRA